ncbi:TetR/AcrR family transcriptional regulator [Salicibibacter cibarius]|uniref:TetR/AcrR family transcriptional regulator n=1 Tax=Salicibibacter cibarius TaxID=2743000 RepID=A0A7T6Z100_9BACI|nr:TetR/AcrR family transcriptional regulator [Salicibibacter cibarius]QQK74706.1 TetR/AcrR family transcriptional regulator [Salicibibacter cibarius]
MNVENKKMDTNERILHAAIELIAEKSYKEVPTKEIAAKASVSEMTLFRHFGSKKRMLVEAADRFYYTVSMKKIFLEKIQWDLESDLLIIAETYHKLIRKNKNLILIAIKEGNKIPDLLEQINKHPRQLKDLLIEYFSQMQDCGAMIPGNVEEYAMAFLYMNYGEFLSRSFVAGNMITSIPDSNFRKASVKLFARGLSVNS